MKTLKLFELYETKTKDNGIIVEKYKPNPLLELSILSINLKTKRPEYKKILEYSIHYNLEMYKIYHPLKKFDTFWVSSDHSLIVLDVILSKLVKISPKEILGERYRYLLVKHYKDNIVEYIPCNDVVIEYDKNVTIGGDFTVEDNYTFSTHDGIFVQDTVAIFHPLSQESQQEIQEKMITTHSASTFTETAKDLSQDAVLGLYVLTK